MKALFPVLTPVLQQPVPYVMLAHSSGCWVMYEYLRLVHDGGHPLPLQIVVACFPPPSRLPADRPWHELLGGAAGWAKLDDDAFLEACKRLGAPRYVMKPEFGSVVADEAKPHVIEVVEKVIASSSLRFLLSEDALERADA